MAKEHKSKFATFSESATFVFVAFFGVFGLILVVFPFPMCMGARSSCIAYVVWLVRFSTLVLGGGWYLLWLRYVFINTKKVPKLFWIVSLVPISIALLYGFQGPITLFFKGAFRIRLDDIDQLRALRDWVHSAFIYAMPLYAAWAGWIVFWNWKKLKNSSS